MSTRTSDFRCMSRRDVISLREHQPVKQGLVMDQLPGFPKRPYKRKKKNFYSLLSIEGDRPSTWPPRPLIARCRSRGHGHAVQHESPRGVDMPPPYCQ